jgi:serine/threonine-protein kinase RsbT
MVDSGADHCIQLSFEIPENDFQAAGAASSAVKNRLSMLGITPDIIKKATIAMYEAEINAVIHANGGVANLTVTDEEILIEIKDRGPGIPDIELAMKEGYSTATDKIRELGFGAGMGLPNMKRYADRLEVTSAVGIGTTVSIYVSIKPKL